MPIFKTVAEQRRAAEGKELEYSAKPGKIENRQILLVFMVLMSYYWTV